MPYQFIVQTFADQFAQLLAVRHQVFSSVFAEHAFSDLQHPGINQLIEVVCADFLEQVHSRALVDGVVDGTGNIHLLDIAGERLGFKRALLLPVIHGNNALEGALEVQSCLQRHILHLTESRYNTCISGLHRRGTGCRHHQCQDDNSNQNDQSLFHSLSFLSCPKGLLPFLLIG